MAWPLINQNHVRCHDRQKCLLYKRLPRAATDPIAMLVDVDIFPTLPEGKIIFFQMSIEMSLT